MDTSARLISPKLPLTTLLLCVATGAVLALPPLQAALIYNRAAVEDGEIWRLITGNLVHLSPSHFLCNVAALIVIGTLIETRPCRHFPVLCLVSAALIGVMVYALEPGLLVFGGLSGVVTAAVTFFCLRGLRETGARRWVCLAALACLVAKMGIELASGSSLLFLAGAADRDFVPVPLSHTVGAATAVLFFMFARQLESGATPP